MNHKERAGNEMKFLRKLERNFGKYAVPNLMYYIILMYGAGIVIDLVMPGLYYQYLCLDAAAVLRGQVWRLVTFLICPPSSGIFFNLIAMFLYYSLGTTLERVWGTFRFNLYFFSGILFHIIAAFVIYFLMGVSVPLTPFYLNNSLFLAFAAYPGVLAGNFYWGGIFV